MRNTALFTSTATAAFVGYGGRLTSLEDMGQTYFFGGYGSRLTSLGNMEADLLLCNKIRWMSAENYLERFFWIKKKKKPFNFLISVTSDNTQVKELQNADFFFSFLSWHLSQTSIIIWINPTEPLGCKEPLLSDVVGDINCFRNKLAIFKIALGKKTHKLWPIYQAPRDQKKKETDRWRPAGSFLHSVQMYMIDWLIMIEFNKDLRLRRFLCEPGSAPFSFWH